jgi:dienelactone hydrolase
MNDPNGLRRDLRRWLRLGPPAPGVEAEVVAVDLGPSFERRRVTYRGPDGDPIPAFLLVPRGLRGPAPAVVVHHQHHGERHFGKSEACGLIGDPLQAFGPALAERGFIVLAPDSICFEDRRRGCTGTGPHPDDWQQHYDEMSYRLLRGDTLMRKVLEDAEAAVSLLAGLDPVDPSRIGILGHSYGGNTVLFQAALDERARYACASGAACSFRNKMQHATGIEMAEVLPGALDRFDIEDLLKLAAPRPMLVVSASDDPYSRDADELVRLAGPAYMAARAPAALRHARYRGGHALTRERFDCIVEWAVSAASGEAPG